MLSKRIIPCLDVYNGRVVKGVNFVQLKDAGDPVEVAKEYNKMGADEVVFLDIAASGENRKTIVDIVNRTASQIFIPLTVGGGINELSDVKQLLNAGADKVSVNTAAVKNPRLISEISAKYGAQCTVVAVDAKRNIDGVGWSVFIQGGKKETGIDVIEWCKKIAELGAGEILLTSIDRDGTRAGYDTELLSLVSSLVNIPVIASGGAGNMSHFYDAFTIGKADAALAASLFHYGEITIPDLKNYLSSRGIAIRNK